MTPVANCNRRKRLLGLVQDQFGQMSLFLSASILIIMTIIAFVINVGLFVKAKINLQNATDAAAYAGASVQARQLTKIAYLNWEMRNIYKEWLYKYYVLGNLNVSDVKNSSGSGTMKFNLQADSFSDPRLEDPFNIPSVCIHLSNSQFNICRFYSIPGVPQFAPNNLLGQTTATDLFEDIITQNKMEDCYSRSEANFKVANLWTYNVLTSNSNSSLTDEAFPILSDRQGAWPQATELGLRMRNLEKILNREPVAEVCISNCQQQISTLEAQQRIGNERVIKAFYSAYRNLGNEEENEMKSSFVLKELSPTAYFEQNEMNPSNLLIPTAYPKKYVDLKLMMVNYTIFFNHFVPDKGTLTINGREYQDEGRCSLSKVAIPVPGYSLGFYKNPDVLTYYAVKGEAEFTGMFNPFKQNAFTLEAYAAAKPMGGRIGPMLFTEKNNYLTARSDNMRSVPYMASFKFEGTSIGNDIYSETNGKKYIPGLPIPTNSRTFPGSFWLEDVSNPIGGKLADPANIRFGLPNLVFDYDIDYSNRTYTTRDQGIHFISPLSRDQSVGLFSKQQFEKFKGQITNVPIIKKDDMERELERLRIPTKYEAANYLIPSLSDINKNNKLDAFGFINSSKRVKSRSDFNVFQSDIWAPLYDNDQEDVLYKNPSEIIGIVNDFIKNQEGAMIKYTMSVNKVAQNIYEQNPNDPKWRAAANSVSDIFAPNMRAEDIDLTKKPKSCQSLLGKFLYSFSGTVNPKVTPDDTSLCPLPLSTLLTEYFSNPQPGYDRQFYSLKYSYPSNDRFEEYLFSGYMPGPFKGANEDGLLLNPLNPSLLSNSTRRNYYSTKFVSLPSVSSKVIPQNYRNENFAIFTEGKVAPTLNLKHSFKNSLNNFNDDNINY